MKLNNYQNAWASMMNIVKRFIQAHPEYELTPFDFDMNVTEKEFPTGNLIGVYQMEYTEDDTNMYARLMFPISIDDTFLLNQVVGEFVNFIAAQERHPLINYGNSQTIGQMVALNELNVSPAVKSTNKQFKFILQGFAFDRSSSFPLS